MTAPGLNSHALAADDLIEALTSFATANLPVFVWGPPGIGKSAIVLAIADFLGIELIDIRCVQFDPVDMRGIPANVDGKTVWLTPDMWPTDGKGIIFLDELTAAPPLVQAAMYQLVLDRRLGDYVLPDGWTVIAAGNRTTDRAVSHRMPSPLANRFTHFELTATLEPWIKWALENEIAPEIVSFLRYMPDHLFTFDAKANETRFATPRTWERASNILAMKLASHVEYASLAGTVGDGPAADLAGFLATYRGMPDPDDVLKNPKTAAVPAADEPSVMFALSGMLAYRANAENFEAVCTYARRLPDEFTVRTVVDAVKRKEELQETKAFIQFSVDYQDLIL